MNVLGEIQNLISEYSGTEKEKITMESHLIEDINLDPLSISDIITSIESKYSVEISERDVRSFVKVSDIVEFIEDHV